MLVHLNYRSKTIDNFRPPQHGGVRTGNRPLAKTLRMVADSFRHIRFGRVVSPTIHFTIPLQFLRALFSFNFIFSLKVRCFTEVYEFIQAYKRYEAPRERLYQTGYRGYSGEQLFMIANAQVCFNFNDLLENTDFLISIPGLFGT